MINTSTEKTCPSCETLKPIDLFNSQGKYCKPCHNEKGKQWRLANAAKSKTSKRAYMLRVRKTEHFKQKQREHSKNYYVNHRETQKARTRNWERRYVEKIGQFILEYLLRNPCIDCGESNPVKLSFDHVRGTKSFNIGEASTLKRSESIIIDEIAKCEVRCFNCHMFKTAKDGNFIGYRLWAKHVESI